MVCVSNKNVLLEWGNTQGFEVNKIGIKVNLHPFLDGLTGGVKRTEVNGRTVGECLTQLVAQFPGIERGLFDKGNNKLLSTIGVWVNGEDAYPDELDKPVKEGDDIHITALIGGG